MEKRTLRQVRRVDIKIFAFSLAACAAIGLTLIEGPLLRELAERGKSRLSQMMRLEEIDWEEVGATNLSQRVSKDLLWKASLLRIGQEMFTIDLPTLERNLLTIPWIESVQIQKKLPSTILVRYTVHQARAFGLRGGKLWSIASSGKWMAPLSNESSRGAARFDDQPSPKGAARFDDQPSPKGAARSDDRMLDLPVLVRESTLEIELDWLDALEKTLHGQLLQVHEVSFAADHAKLQAVVELQYPSQPKKISVIASGTPNSEALIRLNRVVQYLIKNNILVSTIDLRPSKKVVVNVGKRP